MNRMKIGLLQVLVLALAIAAGVPLLIAGMIDDVLWCAALGGGLFGLATGRLVMLVAQR